MEIDLKCTDEVYELSKSKCSILSKEYAKTMIIQSICMNTYNSRQIRPLWRVSDKEILKFILGVYNFVMNANETDNPVWCRGSVKGKKLYARIFVYLINKNGYTKCYNYFLHSRKNIDITKFSNSVSLHMIYELADLNEKYPQESDLVKHYAFFLSRRSFSIKDLMSSVCTMGDSLNTWLGMQVISLMFFRKKNVDTSSSNINAMDKYMGELFPEYGQNWDFPIEQVRTMYISLTAVVFSARLAFDENRKCDIDTVQSCINNIVRLCLKQENIASVRLGVAGKSQNQKELARIGLSNNPPKIISFVNDNILYIGHKVDAHTRKHHEVVAVTGILKTLKGKEAKINTNYCKQCKMYFISTEEYNHYVDKYSPLLGRFSFEMPMSHNTNGMNLAEKSILKLCGYSVSQQDDLRPYDRQAILANIVDNNILTKGKVLDLLGWFITFHGNKHNMQSAVDKWLEDLDWIRDYHIDTQRNYNINKVSASNQSRNKHRRW